MLDFTIDLARRAGSLLLARLDGPRTLTYKGAIDLTTDADRASEELIVEHIRRYFAGHTIIAEEGSGVDSASPYSWLIDPLDGTTNYAHGVPYFSVSIALLYQGQLEIGVVYAPVLGELFAAQRGQGAYCNGRRIGVSARSTLIESICSTGFPYDRARRPDNNLAEFGRVLLRAREVRRVGSAAIDLSYVAAGRYDCHWERDLKPWDSAAGALLVLEAGGTLSDWNGAPWSPASPTLAASNSKIHAELLAVLAG